MIDREDIFWIVGIITVIVIFNLYYPTTVTSTSAGQPIAGAGVDPYSAGEYTLDALAVLGGA